MKKLKKIPLDGPARNRTNAIRRRLARSVYPVVMTRWAMRRHYVEPSKDWSRLIALQWTWRGWPTSWLSCSAPVG
jgi:hypothetical protein